MGQTESLMENKIVQVSACLMAWVSMRYCTVKEDTNLGPLCHCSVAQECLTLCDPMNCSTPGLPVLHHLPKFAQDHVHCIGDSTQPSHPLMPSSPSALNHSQHQGLPMSRLFSSSDQNTEASASASVLPMRIQ